MRLTYREKLDVLDGDLYTYVAGDTDDTDGINPPTYPTKPGETILCPECCADWLNYSSSATDSIWECPACGQEFTTEELIDLQVLPKDPNN